LYRVGVGEKPIVAGLLPELFVGNSKPLDIVDLSLLLRAAAEFVEIFPERYGY